MLCAACHQDITIGELPLLKVKQVSF
jgi:hypothetical protein